MMMMLMGEKFRFADLAMSGLLCELWCKKCGDVQKRVEWRSKNIAHSQSWKKVVLVECNTSVCEQKLSIFAYKKPFA
jgi:hypothetical protein